MDYKWVKMPKLGCFKIFELNIPSCRVFHGLSENQIIIEIEQTEQELWPVKVDHPRFSPLTHSRGEGGV